MTEHSAETISLLEDVMQNTLPRHRPLGITILAIILGLEAIIGIVGPAFFLGIGPGVSQAQGLYIYGFVVLLSLVSLVLAWGLWTLKKWALLTVVVIEGIYLILGIVNYTTHITDVSVAIGSVIIPALVLLYLTLGYVRRAFGER